jgi:glycosyltransferase involved in cell wall biosynthesis
MKLDREKYLNSYRNDYSWYYAAGLSQNDVKAIIYLPSLHHEGRYETDAGVPVRFIRCAAWFKPMEKVRYFARKNRWALYFLERANAMSFVDRLRAGMAEDGVDLLYIQEYWTGRFDYLASRVDVPVCGGDHGGSAPGVVTAFKRKAFANAASVQCQTRAECDSVRSFGGRATFLPNGCDRELFSPAPADAQPPGHSILTVGRLTDHQKRTSDLIRAMVHLPLEWTLDIIGTGPDREMLQRLAAELGVSDRVAFRGFKSRLEVRDAIRNCGVYAMASSNEGMCLALLEAMSCAAAVVVTRIRAFEAVIKDGINGLMVPVGNPAKLAEAVLQAYTCRDQLGRNASDTIARDFDSSVMYRRLARMFRDAAQHRSAAPATLDAQTGLSSDPLSVDHRFE